MSPDPRTALRDMMAQEMALRWRERAKSGAEESPEGHCLDLANAVMEQVFAGQVECRMVYAKPGQPIASYISAETLPEPLTPADDFTGTAFGPDEPCTCPGGLGEHPHRAPNGCDVIGCSCRYFPPPLDHLRGCPSPDGECTCTAESYGTEVS